MRFVQIKSTLKKDDKKEIERCVYSQSYESAVASSCSEGTWQQREREREREKEGEGRRENERERERERDKRIQTDRKIESERKRKKDS